MSEHKHPLHAAFEYIRSANSKPPSHPLSAERDALETKITAISIDLAVTREDIKGLVAMRDEIEAAIRRRRRAEDELVNAYESAERARADVSIRLTQLGE